jgi:hypothetical protein
MRDTIDEEFDLESRRERARERFRLDKTMELAYIEAARMWT